VALKRTGCLQQCSKWCLFALTRVRSRALDWSMTLSMMLCGKLPWCYNSDVENASFPSFHFRTIVEKVIPVADLWMSARVDQSRRSPRPIFHQPKTSTICAPRRWQSIIWRLEASDSSWFVSVLSSFHVISIHFNFYIRVRQFDAHSNSYKLTVKRQETFILSIMSSVRPLLSAGLSLIYSSALLAFVQWSRCFRLVERDKAPLSPSSAFGQRGGTATLCRYSRCEA